MKDNYGRPLSPLITIPFWIIVAMLIIDAIGICQLIGQWVLHGRGEMSDLTRQELCVKLRISESTVRRLEQEGMPCTPVGRAKRYDLAECKQWLRTHQPSTKCPPGSTSKGADTQASWSPVADFIASSQQVQRRTMPSSLKLISGTN